MNQPKPLYRGTVDENYRDVPDRELPLISDDEISKTNVENEYEDMSVAMSQAEEYMQLRSPSRMISTETLRDKHHIPAAQYVFVGVWSALLLLNFFWTRLWCSFGIPSDCHSHFRVTNFEDIKELFTLGLIICFLTGMHLPERFFYVFDFKRNYWRGISFITLFFLGVPVFGSIGLIPFLTHFNITPDKLNSPSFINILLTITVLTLISGLVGFHIIQAFRRYTKTEFVTYVLSRGLVWLFYILYGILCFQDAADRGLTFHLHHYFLAFLISIMAEFNHPFSLVVLALSTSVFVEGLAAYEAAPLFSALDWVR